MGKSDFYLSDFYTHLIEGDKFESVGFFGQSGENFISSKIIANKKYFYDLSLGNWNINTLPYSVENKFDLIVCTRCAYFCKHPDMLIDNFTSLLKPGGKILIDWGLGDHWRFKNYKVGWIKNNEQEYAYADDNFLWSCVWHESFNDDRHVRAFKQNIQKFDYRDELGNIIKSEVTFVLDPYQIKCKKLTITHLSLWPDAPQLYTCLLIEV